MSQNDAATTTAEDESTPRPLAEFTGFQRDILSVLAAGGPRYGLAIKRELEAHYGEVNHGRLYPNLDELEEEGLIEKSQRDKRTNEYGLSETGHRRVEADAEWRVAAADGDETILSGQ